MSAEDILPLLLEKIKPKIVVISAYERRKNHQAKECKLQEQSCVHCGDKGKHHRSLCPTKFSESNKEHKDIRKHQTENNLIGLGENVVMQTVLVTVENSDNRALKMETRVLLETGNQRTYITKDLADELKLKT